MSVYQRIFLSCAVFISSFTMPVAAMQQVTRQEAELMQTEQFFSEQIDNSQEKFWDRIRNILMLSCGVIAADYAVTQQEFAKSDQDQVLWKGHARGSYALLAAATLVALREVAGMVGDIRKIAEFTHLLTLVRQQLVELEDKRRLRKPAPKQPVGEETSSDSTH